MKRANKSKILIIIDMQEDFINGILGTSEAQLIVHNIVKKLKTNGKNYSAILITKNSYNKKYKNTFGGSKVLIPDCIEGTNGYRLVSDIYKEIEKLRRIGVTVKNFKKHTFVSNELVEYLKSLNLICNNDFEIEIIGVSTDICVISNALTIKATLPNTVISIDAKCCAGTSIKTHNAALRIMNSCQIDTGLKVKQNRNNSRR